MKCICILINHKTIDPNVFITRFPATFVLNISFLFKSSNLHNTSQQQIRNQNHSKLYTFKRKLLSPSTSSLCSFLTASRYKTILALPSPKKEHLSTRLNGKLQFLCYGFALLKRNEAKTLTL